MTDLGIVDFACNYSVSCPYAMRCLSKSCGDECNLCLSEPDAESLRENYDTRCKPFLLDRCLTDIGFFYRYECEGSGITIFDHQEQSCGDPGVRDTIVKDNATCTRFWFDGTYSYSVVDCGPHVIKPGSIFFRLFLDIFCNINF